MAQSSPSEGHRFLMRLRAPAEGRGVLLKPALGELPDLVRHNHDVLSRISVPILGEPFQSVRAMAQQELAAVSSAVGAAPGKTGSSGQTPFPPAPFLVVMTGHQPAPFHPGVWIKNFLTYRLAQAVGAFPLNVVVDNDAARGLEIAVPRMTEDGSAAVTRVPLTAGAANTEAAYEECPAPSAEELDEAGSRILAACPLDAMRDGFRQFWGIVRDVHRPGQTIAECLATARHGLEVVHGIENREVLMSAVAATRAFRLLFLHILSDARRFAEVHNAALGEFRRARRIRNRAHPVPELAVNDGVELPYWVWRAGERRRRLTARFTTRDIELRSGEDLVLSAPGERLLDVTSGVDLLADALARGWKVRPRALTTTIFCRLFVADAFIHGIGGGTYDLLTDAIIERFFGIEAPAYIVCSATVRLPVPSHGASVADLRRQEWLLRDLKYNPDRHLGDCGLRISDCGLTDAKAADLANPKSAIRNPPSLVERKRELIGRPRGATPAERRAVFDAIRAVNAALAGAVADQRGATQRRIADLRRALAADAILTSREYPFCLFPPGVLPAFYDQALARLGT